MDQTTIIILDPVGDKANTSVTMAPRPGDLRATRLGVLDTGWRSFSVFLDHLIPQLRDQFELSDVVRCKGDRGVPSDDSFPSLSKTDIVLNGLAN